MPSSTCVTFKRKKLLWTGNSELSGIVTVGCCQRTPRYPGAWAVASMLVFAKEPGWLHPSISNLIDVLLEGKKNYFKLSLYAWRLELDPCKQRSNQGFIYMEELNFENSLGY